MDLLLTIGLFLRLEAARKLLQWLSVFTVVLSVLLIVGFVMLIQRTNHAKQEFNAAIATLEDKNLTTAQDRQVEALKTSFENLEKQIGRSAVLVYVKYSATIVAYTGIAIYLSRPKVKAVFRTELK